MFYLILLHCCVDKRCPKDQYKCLNVYQCVPIERRFDGIRDCLDGSDEMGSGKCTVDQCWLLLRFHTVC